MNTSNTTRLRELLDEIGAKQAEEIVAIHFGGYRRRAVMTTSTATSSSSAYDPYAYGRMVRIAIMDPVYPVWSPSTSAMEEAPAIRQIDVMSLGNGMAIDPKNGEMHPIPWTSQAHR